jgi:predicted ATPase/class 3 adenylate cyclase
MADLPSGTVTFLFTDLVVSTRLWELEREAMSSALARHDEILRAAIAAYGGQVVKGRGDGVHAVFVTADDAVGASIEIQRVLAAESWSVSEPLRVRVGVHTGVAELRDGDYFGSAVNRAARLEAIAHGGQIVVSQATEALVRDGLDDGVVLVDLGEHRLRGLSRAERVFQVVHPQLEQEFPALQSLEALPGKLPVQLTSFVGREQELATLAELLEESRLVTLTGVGGVGKTRLALQVAEEVLHKFRDGVWLCELGATNDADLLGQVLVVALGAQPRPERSLVESTCVFLASKHALIVLDNCEHLLDAAADAAEAMLRAAPGVRVLATSREPLGVAGERVVAVRSLQVASEPDVEAIAACDAVRLFVERAAAARAEFRLDADNADAIVEICRRLDGIPLAVELAAARVTSMGPREIADLLDERFQLLTGGRRRGVERQQTLRATVDWSYSLLDARDRAVFARLGVFAGSFDADAATAVAADDGLSAWEVRDALDHLAAKSMVDLDTGPRASTRYRLLETLRQFALERLEQTGQAEECRRRHAAYYAGFAGMAGPGMEGPDEVSWAARFEVELDNLRAAVAWALDAEAQDDAELGLRITGSLASQRFCRPSIGVGEWAEAALSRIETSTPALRTSVLAVAAFNAYMDGDFDLMRTRAADALDDGLPAGTPFPAQAYVVLVLAEAIDGNYEAAVQTATAGERAFDRVGADEFSYLWLVLGRVLAHMLASEYEAARVPAEEFLQRARVHANPSLLIGALFYFAWTRRADESKDRIEALEECLAHSRAVDTRYNPQAVRALALLAPLLVGQDDRSQAIAALHEAVVRAYDTGQLPMMAFVLNHGVSVATDLAAWELAAVLGAAVESGPLTGKDVLVHPGERAERRVALDHVRTQLDAGRYSAAVTRATTMTYQQVVEHTLTELDRLRAQTPGAAEAAQLGRAPGF